MSIHVQEPSTQFVGAEGRPGEPRSVAAEPLAPILSLRWALTWQHAVVAVFLAIYFILLAHVPLKPYGIFRDLVDARSTWIAGSLPTQDPLLAYAETSRYAVLNLGGALIEAGVESVAGAEGLSTLATLCAFGSVLLWCRFATNASGSALVAVPTAIGCFAASWGTLGYAGTPMFGRLMLPMLFLTLQAAGVLGRRSNGAPAGLSRDGRWLWSLPPMFAIWANLDPSWILGVGALALVAAGRLLEGLNGRRRFSQGASSLDLATFSGLAVTATLLNPYGWKLWGLATLPSANNPFVASLGGLAPIEAWSLSGILVGLALVIFASVSRRASQLTWAERLLLAALVVGSFAHPLARAWTLPALAAIIAPSLTLAIAESRIAKAVRVRSAELLRTLRRSSRRGSAVGALPDRGFAWTLLCGLAVWMAIALTPLGNPLFGSAGRPFDRVVSGVPFSELPDDLFAPGVAFVPLDWAEAAAYGAWRDSLRTTGPGPRLLADSRQLFVAPSLRGDLSLILRADASWPKLLERYAVKTLVLDPVSHASLIAAVRGDKRWKEAGDPTSFVRFVREERVR